MAKKITYLNPNIKNYTEYNIIVEDDNNQSFLTKYDDNLEKLLNQEILIEKIKNEKKIINTEIEKSEKNIWNKMVYIAYTITYLQFPILTKFLLNIFTSTDNIIYISRLSTEFSYSTFVAGLTATVTTPTGLIALILINNKRKKEINKHNNLELQYKNINETLEREATKEKELKQKVNLEKNSIKLETKSIGANEEKNRIMNDLQPIYQSNDDNNEKTSNKCLIKNL